MIRKLGRAVGALGSFLGPLTWGVDLFSVAQIVNLLYRRLPIGWALVEIRLSRQPRQSLGVRMKVERLEQFPPAAAHRAEPLERGSATRSRSPGNMRVLTLR